MKNCLIIINKNAGTSKKISFEKVEKCLGSEYKYEHRTIPGANVDVRRRRNTGFDFKRRAR